MLVTLWDWGFKHLFHILHLGHCYLEIGRKNYILKVIKNWKKKTLERWWKCPITHIWGRCITSSKCFHDSPVGFCTPHNIWLPSELHFPCRPFQSSMHFSKPVHSFQPFHSSQWWIIFLLHKILAWTFFFFLTLLSFFFVFSNPVRKIFFRLKKTPVVHKVYSQTY